MVTSFTSASDLYPDHVDDLQRYALYMLYKNPTRPSKQIELLINAGWGVVVGIYPMIADDYTSMGRVQLFHQLGYINPRPVDVIDPLHEKIIRIFSDNPCSSAEVVAQSLNVPLKVARQYIESTYDALGFQPGKRYSEVLTRLQFYHFINWFDSGRLRDDAVANYAPIPSARKLYGFGLTQRMIDVLTKFYISPYMMIADIERRKINRRDFQRARDHMFTVYKKPLPQTESTRDMLHLVGYVNIPPYLHGVDDRINEVLALLHENPFAPNYKLGDVLNYSKDNARYQLKKLQTFMNITRPAGINTSLFKLMFYSQMNWFDEDLLRFHAEVLSRKLQNRQ